MALVDAIDELERGRESYARRAWTDAYASLARADRWAPLGANDLELLATTAYMLGQDNEHVSGLERAHHAHLEAGEPLRAVRCAFWAGVNLALRGEIGPASGWFGRAQRLVERAEHDSVEPGYLLIPVMLQQEESGDYGAAYSTAHAAAELGERFGEQDLVALALHMQGRARVKQARVEEGLALLDEAMVAVTAGELSPIVTGLVYCSVIEGCQEVYALRRAREWTAALTRWCAEQPDLVAFTGRCLVHRAEIMQLQGAWLDALEEARRAGERCARSRNQPAAADAFYQQGEVHRLRGEFGAAEQAYKEAANCGRETQPGLALLRLAQGKVAPAAAAIRRATGEAAEPLARARLLPAYVEIALAAGDTEAAAGACLELEAISARYDSDLLGGIVAHTRGAVDLAESDPWAALVPLRRALHLWQDLNAPYEGARTRTLIALACRALDDEDTAAMELDAARAVFAELGATPDLARVDALFGGAKTRDAHGLTARELEVLRLVAAGRSNREIASALVISEHTVARHVQNIFAKLRVSSRTGASAFAFEHGLV